MRKKNQIISKNSKRTQSNSEELKELTGAQQKSIEALLLLKKANVFPSLSSSSSSSSFLLPQIKELEAPRVPWAGRLKSMFSGVLSLTIASKKDQKSQNICELVIFDEAKYYFQ